MGSQKNPLITKDKLLKHLIICLGCSKGSCVELWIVSKVWIRSYLQFCAYLFCFSEPMQQQPNYSSNLAKTINPLLHNEDIAQRTYDQDTPQSQTRARGYTTWVNSQNKAQWLAVCGHVSASSQSLGFILRLRLYSSFITSGPGRGTERKEETIEQIHI